MATNKIRWVRNMNGAKAPLVKLALFQAGATQAVKRGELLDLSSGNCVPLASDKAMAGIIVIANEEIKSGDRAGYYEVIVPRAGDVFEYDMDTAAAVAIGASLYYSSSEAVSATGTNVLGNSVGQEHYPDKQGHLADDASGDAGTTVRSTAQVRMTIKAAASYYAALQT